MNKKILIVVTIILVSLFVMVSFSSAINFQNQKIDSNYPIYKNNAAIISNEQNNSLDVQFIYNLTEKLSNIIFDEYDEEDGEIAKGRAFGTKGEHKAAEIIFENMTDIGLYTYYERLKNFEQYPTNRVTNKLEIIDYDFKLNGKSIDCYPAPAWYGERGARDELNVTFNYSGLKIKKIPKDVLIFNKTLFEEKSDFMFIAEDIINNPDGRLPIIDLLKPLVNPLKFYMLFYFGAIFNINRQTSFWYNWYPSCKGLILYDYTDNCHDMLVYDKPLSNNLPIIYVNGTVGRDILNDIENQNVDFYLKQRYNTSVLSYNVIGQINGTDTTKTAIVCSLYDSWWCQGTADSAIAMSMVLAIAKYFIENDIKPRYTLKFIGFSGEEYGYKGAIYYEKYHTDEDIVYVIDLNQVGFTQVEPRLTFDIVANKLDFLNDIWNVAQRSNYVERTNDTADIEKIWWPSGSIPSNTYPFGTNRNNCNVVSFFKDGGWVLHHRDGPDENCNKHMEGDVLKYFNWTDTAVTGEMVLNITKYLIIESNNNYRFEDSTFNIFNILEHILRAKD